MDAVVARAREFFSTGQTRSLDFRREQLIKLKNALKANQKELLRALYQDLHKSAFEAYSSELGFLLEEIDFALAKLRKWSKPERVRTPMLYQWSSSWVYPQPRGTVLIIGAWNYPLNLLIGPLIPAIAAGNCAILKPSELAPATAAVMAKMISECFDPNYCALINGGIEETTALLKQPFDHIFFTGSTTVGRIVMKAAAENLSSVTLELGGKSPCVVDQSADISVTARRIAWAKFYNAGQTCVAPDYLLVHHKIKAPLLEAIQKETTNFFGLDAERSPDFGRIINDRHFQRLNKLLDHERTIFGGSTDVAKRYIAPTILDGVSLTQPVMQEEIFGPILPVLAYEHFDEVTSIIKGMPNPLAAYFFANNARLAQRFIDEVPFGGGCINNALIHLANPHLPFGGVGASGMGSYHGKAGFDVFSHKKAVMKSSFKFDLKLKYPPYKKRFSLLKWVMR